MSDDGESSLERCEWYACDVNLGGIPSFEWWILTLELQEDGLIEDSKDDLEHFPNVVLVVSNLDEERCVKLLSWKEDLEGRLHFLPVASVEVSNEEECKKLFSVSIETFLSMNKSSEELKSEFKDEDSEDGLAQSENEALKDLFKVENVLKEDKMKS